MLIRYLERIGAFVLLRLEYIGSVVLLLLETLRQLRHFPRMRHVLAQMSHLGVDSLLIVGLTLLFTGMVMTLQIAHEFIRFGAQSTIGRGNYHCHRARAWPCARRRRLLQDVSVPQSRLKSVR